MNCQSFENNVTELARRRPLEANLLDEAMAHSESCATCAKRLKEQQTLTAGLRDLSGQMKSLEVPGGIETQLVEAFRQHVALPKYVQPVSRRWLVAAGIAAILLAVVGAISLRLSSSAVSLVRDNSTPTVDKVTQQDNSGSPTTELPAVVAVSYPSKPDLQRRRGVVTKGQHLRPSKNADSTIAQKPSKSLTVAEVTTDFMPLGDTSVVNLQDGAQVVRVEMPRYAMARFGLPVNMERYDERVKADVWVGVDGLARAIRFVQ